MPTRTVLAACHRASWRHCKEASQNEFWLDGYETHQFRIIRFFIPRHQNSSFCSCVGGGLVNMSSFQYRCRLLLSFMSDKYKRTCMDGTRPCIRHSNFPGTRLIDSFPGGVRVENLHACIIISQMRQLTHEHNRLLWTKIQNNNRGKKNAECNSSRRSDIEFLVLHTPKQSYRNRVLQVLS